jgi:succinate dehydrogenase/fumarate reductase cytochrome b subunit
MCRVTPLAAAVLELLELVSDEEALLVTELLTLEVALLLELLALLLSLELPPPQAISAALNSAALSQVVIFFMRPSFCICFFRHCRLGLRLLLTDLGRC